MIQPVVHVCRGRRNFLLPEACWEYSRAVLLVSWNIFSTSNFIAVFLPGGETYIMKVATSLTVQSIPQTVVSREMGQIPVRLLSCKISTFSAVSDDESGCEHNWDVLKRQLHTHLTMPNAYIMSSLVPRPSLASVFDHLQIAKLSLVPRPPPFLFFGLRSV